MINLRKGGVMYKTCKHCGQLPESFKDKDKQELIMFLMLHHRREGSPIKKKGGGFDFKLVDYEAQGQARMNKAQKVAGLQRRIAALYDTDKAALLALYHGISHPSFVRTGATLDDAYVDLNDYAFKNYEKLEAYLSDERLSAIGAVRRALQEKIIQRRSLGKEGSELIFTADDTRFARSGPGEDVVEIAAQLYLDYPERYNIKLGMKTVKMGRPPKKEEEIIETAVSTDINNEL